MSMPMAGFTVVFSFGLAMIVAKVSKKRSSNFIFIDIGFG
jgi:hypothetical protein